jgi:hypothetical protein
MTEIDTALRLEKLQKELKEKDVVIAAQSEELAQKDAALAAKDRALAAKEQQLVAKAQEIEQLKIEKAAQAKDREIELLKQNPPPPPPPRTESSGVSVPSSAALPKFDGN